MRRLVLPALFPLFTLLLLSAHPLLGQTSSLEPGTRLRVNIQGFELSGEFVRWDGDTLVVRPESAGPGIRADQATASSAIQRLDRSVPRSRGRGAVRGLLWGALIGGLAGAGLGAVQETDCFLCPDSHTEGALWGATALGVLGTGVGALVGVIVPGTRWEPVPLEREGSS
jgi:hypothetical protein